MPFSSSRPWSRGQGSNVVHRLVAALQRSKLTGVCPPLCPPTAGFFSLLARTELSCSPRPWDPGPNHGGVLLQFSTGPKAEVLTLTLGGPPASGVSPAPGSEQVLDLWESKNTPQDILPSFAITSPNLSSQNADFIRSLCSLAKWNGAGKDGVGLGPHCPQSTG